MRRGMIGTAQIAGFIGRVNFRELGIFYALIAAWVLLFCFTAQFRQWDTYATILRQASFAGICGVGMTLCIASRHFDQSIGAMTAFLGCTFTTLLSAFARPVVTDPATGAQTGGISFFGVMAAILIILALGIVCGLFNGVLVAKLRIPAFIATLGTLYVFRGSAYLVSNSKPVIINQIVTRRQYGFFNFLGTGSILGLPFSFWVMALCAAAGTIILRRMKLGRDTLAIGNSIEASRISGIDIDWTKVLIFTLLGAFVGIGSLLNTTYLASSNPGMVNGFEFTVITTVVLGGTALAGGKGSVFNSIVAAHFLVTITVGMNALGVNPYYQRIFQGVILLFAFSINEIRAMLDSRRVKVAARRDTRLANKISQ